MKCETTNIDYVHRRRQIKRPPGVSHRAAITGGTECYWVPNGSDHELSRSYAALFGTV